jgi:hypothetical protein
MLAIRRLRKRQHRYIRGMLVPGRCRHQRDLTCTHPDAWIAGGYALSTSWPLGTSRQHYFDNGVQETGIGFKRARAQED